MITIHGTGCCQINKTGVPPNSYSLGGASVVSLAHAAQVLGKRSQTSFFGVRGNDEAADFIESYIKKIPFKGYCLVKKDFPAEEAANHFCPEDLPDGFFNANIVAFGGTALVPKIHANLTGLLKKARDANAITMVNLISGSPAGIAMPGKKCPLGANDDAYPYIDVLVANKETAVKTSGAVSVKEAIHWFISRGTGAIIVTDGRHSISFTAVKGIFSPMELSYLPVCQEIERELAAHPGRCGDSAGCGYNFAGGVLADIAEQLTVTPKGKLDMRESVIQGIATGGFALFTTGGIYYESGIGEKRNRLTQYLEAYCRQLVNRA